MNKQQTAVSLNELPEFCSMEDLSSLLHISRATAYRMAANGTIPCLRIGRRVVLYREHIRNWINGANSMKEVG